jgi:Ca2+-binding EF-hand superfamily protein
MRGPDTLLDEIEEMFARIDEDGDRIINYEEFTRLMRAMDRTRPAASLRDCFDAIDADHDGRVNFEEFRAWCGGWR